jgi:hypothetical protein
MHPQLPSQSDNIIAALQPLDRLSTKLLRVPPHSSLRHSQSLSLLSVLVFTVSI